MSKKKSTELVKVEPRKAPIAIEEMESYKKATEERIFQLEKIFRPPVGKSFLLLIGKRY